MPSNRINRVNEDIRLCLSKLITEVKDPRVQQGLLSVVRTETTGDLKYCKVYLSCMGLQSEKDFMKGLKSASGWLRRELSIRLNLRNTPELTFILDKSIEYGAHINSIINSLDIKEDEDEEADEN
ncbi:MAG: 30S ribosome-binding factor RbfA [Oscillospiraceae bacterium]|nr:30S ribosome-binding factor RbfA [Oscillospiraceae bacterium]MBR1842714.1 30S ribosome-binding factor RbfA [Oscillospiraceae bacterium]